MLTGYRLAACLPLFTGRIKTLVIFVLAFSGLSDCGGTMLLGSRRYRRLR